MLEPLHFEFARPLHRVALFLRRRRELHSTHKEGALAIDSAIVEPAAFNLFVGALNKFNLLGFKVVPREGRLEG
jgi:hypothetical protein